MLTDEEAGITAFATCGSGFSGILKHRYRDFQVSEVDLTGRVAQLTNTEVSPESGDQQQEQQLQQHQEQGPVQELSQDSIPEVVQAFAAIAGADNAQLLQHFLQQVLDQRQLQPQPRPGLQEQQQVDEQRVVSDNGAAGAAASLERTAGDTSSSSSKHGALLHLLPVTDRDARRVIHQFFRTQPHMQALRFLTDTVAAEPAAPAGGDGDNAAGAAAAPQGDAATTAAAAADAKPAMTVVRVKLPAKQGSAAGRGGQQQQRQQQQGRKRKREEGRGSSAWGGGKDNRHVRFVLYKENMDTQAALGVIGRMLRVGSNCWGFAGTKDKRGVTSQFTTLFKVAPERLAALNSKLRGIKLGNFDFVPEQLRLGQLRGNRFRILMRDVQAPGGEQQVADACAELRRCGFINYFGLQRFGTGSVPTHAVGAALLRGEWEAAVRLILSGSESEREDIRQGRKMFLEQGDIKGALRLLPHFLTAERAILEALGRDPASGSARDHAGALAAVPRTLRTMYLHAWQSKVWNAAASARIERYGSDRAVAGDLVLLPQGGSGGGGGGGGAAVGPAGVGGAAAGADALDGGAFGGTAAGEGGEAEAGEQEDGGGGGGAAARRAAAHVVTEEEAARGRFSIEDVVLPLPGVSVRYPLHAAGLQLYRQLAAEAGVQLSEEPSAAPEGTSAPAAAAAPGAAQPERVAPAAAGAAQQQPGAAGVEAPGEAGRRLQQQPGQQQQGQRRVREFSFDCLAGDYRCLVHVPKDLEWELLRYSHPDDDSLVATDWEALQQRQRQRQQQQVGQVDGAGPPAGGAAAAAAAGGAGAEAMEVDGAGADAAAAAAAQDGSQEAAGASAEAAAGNTNGSTTPAGVGAQAAAGADAADATDAADAAAAAAAAPEAAAAVAPAALEERRYLALELSFTLPSSCYATMLVRELTKASTSKESQRLLSQTGGGA